MPRHHIIPGAVLLGICFILSLLVSISLPYVRAFDVARASFGSGQTTGVSADQASNIRWGIWGICAESAASGDWSCTSTGYAYTTNVGGQVIGKSWTRGLVIHPIATAVILIAWLLSFSNHLTVMLISSLVSFLGALFTLIVFAIDIALFANIKAKMDNIGGKAKPGPAFWMTLVVLVLTSISGCVVCFGRRRARGTEEYKIETKKPWYHKFRRNRY